MVYEVEALGEVEALEGKSTKQAQLDFFLDAQLREDRYTQTSHGALFDRLGFSMVAIT